MDARCGLLSNISLEYFRNRRDNFHFLLSHTRIKRFSLALKFSKSFFFLLNSLLSFFSYHSEFHHFMFKKNFFFRFWRYFTFESFESKMSVETEIDVIKDSLTNLAMKADSSESSSVSIEKVKPMIQANDLDQTFESENQISSTKNLLSLTTSIEWPQPVGQNFILNLIDPHLLEDIQFYGNYSRYPYFVSIVQNYIDSDINLNPNLKYAALLKLTRGEARRVILGLFGENVYEEAKNRLEKRYCRPILIQESIIQELKNKTANSGHRNRLFSLIRIRSDLFKFSKLFQLLKANSEWTMKLLSVILESLPNDFIKKYRDSNAELSVDSLLELMDNQISSMEGMSLLDKERRR
ncbi:hypothetical protein SSS_06797 [Sarcoptes scabiei]|uniref:Uncharacterized protein n=1 Tax=Sarcoptes scabiei TaxID=52283 RepID=A0A834RJS5_SARSC|nr:hypothetical protein SSS_06797 [Sarcoptes scabiei]